MTTYTRAALVAVAAAGLFALSPLSAVCGLVMAVMTRRAIARYEGAERRWVSGALIVGIGLRVLCILGMFLLTDQQQQFNVLFGDGRFAVDRSIWILNFASGVPISPYHWLRTFENYGDVQYHHALAIVQWFTGPAPYALSLINVACFEAFAIVFYRMIRSAFGIPAAAATLALVLFWPTIFVWSFSMLKESLQFLLAAAAMAATVGLVRGPRTATRVLSFIGVIAVLWALAELRPGSSAMAAGGIAFGLVAYVSTRRMWLAVAAIVVVALGVFGAAMRPSVQARALAETRLALFRHVGHVNTAGISFHAADDRFYTGDTTSPYTMTRDEGVRFLVRSAVAFFVAPLPRHIGSLSGWLFVPMNLAWFGLLALAVYGIPSALRRDALVAWLSIGYVLAGVAIIAPNSGNIGTLIRHRDMVVPFVMALGSVGLITILPAIVSQSTRRSNASFGRLLEGDV